MPWSLFKRHALVSVSIHFIRAINTNSTNLFCKPLSATNAMVLNGNMKWHLPKEEQDFFNHPNCVSLLFGDRYYQVPEARQYYRIPKYTSVQYLCCLSVWQYPQPPVSLPASIQYHSETLRQSVVSSISGRQYPQSVVSSISAVWRLRLLLFPLTVASGTQDALHYTALHCTAVLYCTALQFCTALYGTRRQYSALYGGTLYLAIFYC